MVSRFDDDEEDDDEHDRDAMYSITTTLSG
jgi:hypothetical protein